jgi:hypothetical protein
MSEKSKGKGEGEYSEILEFSGGLKLRQFFAIIENEMLSPGENAQIFIKMDIKCPWSTPREIACFSLNGSNHLLKNHFT